MDSWIVVTVLVMSVVVGALSGWVLLGPDGYQTRHRASERPGQIAIGRQGRHRGRPGPPGTPHGTDHVGRRTAQGARPAAPASPPVGASQRRCTVVSSATDAFCRRLPSQLGWLLVLTTAAGGSDHARAERSGARGAVAAAFLLLMRPVAVRRDMDGDHHPVRGMLMDLRDGFVYMVRTPWLLATLLFGSVGESRWPP